MDVRETRVWDVVWWSAMDCVGARGGDDSNGMKSLSRDEVVGG